MIKDFNSLKDLEAGEYELGLNIFQNKTKKRFYLYKEDRDNPRKTELIGFAEFNWSGPKQQWVEDLEK